MQTKVEICGVNTSGLPVLSAKKTDELLKKSAAGNKQARDELIRGNLRLVLSVVQRFQGRGESPDDLFQVGCIGLMKAIDNFNTELGVRFSTYAVPMIIGGVITGSIMITSGEIRRYLRDNSAMRVSRSLRDTAYRALQAKEAFIREHQREPDIVELAKLMDVPKEEVVFALDAILDPVSLFEPVFHDGTDTVCVMDQVGDTKNTDDNWLAGIALRDAMRSLNDRERRIIRLRFFEGRTQMEVAREIHLSPNKRKEDSGPFLTIYNVRAAENARIGANGLRLSPSEYPHNI